jgi:hypothetical protein
MSHSSFTATTPTRKPPQLSAEVQAVIAKPALLNSEDPESFEILFANMAAAVRPRDAIEWVLLEDCVQLTYEIRRLHRAKAGILKVTEKEALISILESLLDPKELNGTDRAALAEIKASESYNDPSAKEALRALLAKHRLDEDAIMAQAFALRTHELEKLDQMLASLERRRFAMLQEMGIYRDLFTMRVRDEIYVVDENPDELTLQPPQPPASDPQTVGAPSEHQP